MTLKDEAVKGVYALKQRAWRDKLERYRDNARDPLVSARVLVRMDAGIGNAVEATPLVQAIRMLWPRVHVTILPPPVDLFDDWVVVDRVARSADDLEGERFDATFVPWCVAQPDGTTPFDAGEVHVAQGLFPHWQLRPEREVNLDAVRHLGFDGPTPPLYVSLKQPARELPQAAKRIAISAGGKPVHRWRNKRWPYWAELIEKVLANHGDASVVLVGGPDDEIEGPLPESPRLHDLRGPTSLREMAWVLRRCHLAIGNDCGPMHVADAVLTPSLVLFGPTCEIKNGPRYRGVTLSTNAPCSPCQYDLELLDSCADPVCMKGLAVAAVLAQAGRMLAR